MRPLPGSGMASSMPVVLVCARSPRRFARTLDDVYY